MAMLVMIATISGMTTIAFWSLRTFAEKAPTQQQIESINHRVDKVENKLDTGFSEVFDAIKQSNLRSDLRSYEVQYDAKRTTISNLERVIEQGQATERDYERIRNLTLESEKLLREINKLNKMIK